jgi:hypothetical protein
MDRGLAALLSPNEEVTLRRVAYGIAKPEDLQPSHVARLKRLTLIEDRDGTLFVTQTGRRRLADAPVRRLDNAPVAMDGSVMALAKALKVTKI